MSDHIRKNMPAVDSKTVPVARIVLTTPLASRIPHMQARDRDVRLQQGVMSAQNIQASPNNLANTVNNKAIWHSNWQV